MPELGKSGSAGGPGRATAQVYPPGKHQDQIAGVLSGFDRLVLRGTLRSIAYSQGMSQYLWATRFC